MKKQTGILTTLPAPPKHLPPDARAIWIDVTEYLLDRELLHFGDLGTVEAYAWALARLRRLEALLDEEGLITAKGTAHPALAAANGTGAAVSKIANALGLAPAPRARFAVSVQKAPSKEPDAHEAAWVKLVPKGKRA